MMDFNKLAEDLCLGEDDFIELAELFVETGLSDLKGLRDAIGLEDRENAIQRSHSIKGASGNLGFMDIFELAKKIEADARNGILKGHELAIETMKDKISQLDSFINTRIGKSHQ
jgi:HPt (histidine-containing phosphotransfer) domain-containing protein